MQNCKWQELNLHPAQGHLSLGFFMATRSIASLSPMAAEAFPYESSVGHCREPGEHARGCRVVDLILGKA